VNRVYWTDRAIADLITIGEYIARDNPRVARAWLERLRKRAELAAETPLAGRRVPEIGREDVRETFLRSYRIVYRTSADGITVLTVFEGRRRIGDVDPDAVEGKGDE
jgi:toxin ParE1/3/4